DQWAHSVGVPDAVNVAQFVKGHGFVSPDLNEMTTRLRAAQAALFGHDALMDFDTAALAAGYLNLAPAELSRGSAQSIRRLEHPQRAAAALITLLTRQPPPALKRWTYSTSTA